MNVISPVPNDKGEWFADSSTLTVRPSQRGDACNKRFTTYAGAVHYLVWNAMLGCRFASDDVERQRKALDKAEATCAERCKELAQVIALMEATPSTAVRRHGLARAPANRSFASTFAVTRQGSPDASRAHTSMHQVRRTDADADERRGLTVPRSLLD